MKPQDVDEDNEEWQEYCNFQTGYLSDVGSGSDDDDQVPKVTGACWRRIQPKSQSFAAQGDEATARTSSKVRLPAQRTTTAGYAPSPDGGMPAYLGDEEHQHQRSPPGQKVLI